jgi:DNA-binding CsgD family transcriptional regulator
MSYEETSRPEAKARRRGSKFTSERIRQITVLVARGETCERIAAIIGVSVGTLKVTCSRLGISSRRPKVKLLLPPRATGAARTVGAARDIATFTISMKYKGQERNTALPLTSNMISQLALEASFRDQKIGELAKDLVESVMRNGLFKKVLGE